MTADQHLDADAQTLADMGYKQELHRGMSGFSNFAVSFSIISILAGCITSLQDRPGLRRAVDHRARLAHRRHHGA